MECACPLRCSLYSLWAGLCTVGVGVGERACASVCALVYNDLIQLFLSFLASVPVDIVNSFQLLYKGTQKHAAPNKTFKLYLTSTAITDGDLMELLNGSCM